MGRLRAGCEMDDRCSMTTSQTQPTSSFDRNTFGSSETEIALPIEPIVKERALSERVYRVILEMLTRGGLKQGATLRIDLLAKSLNVSPTPIREAMARLAGTGLVVHEPRKGYSVAPRLTRGQLAELLDARRLLEVGAVGYACLNGGEEFRAELAAAFEMQQAAVRAFHSESEPNASEHQRLAWHVIELDLHFHQVIFKHTRNKLIRVMAEALSAQQQYVICPAVPT